MTALEKKSSDLRVELARPQRVPVLPTWSLWSHPDAVASSRDIRMSGALVAVPMAVLAPATLVPAAALWVQALLAAAMGGAGALVFMGLMEPKLRQRLRRMLP